jgi:hypothetical protein
MFSPAHSNGRPVWSVIVQARPGRCEEDDTGTPSPSQSIPLSSLLQSPCQLDGHGTPGQSSSQASWSHLASSAHARVARSGASSSHKQCGQSRLGKNVVVIDDSDSEPHAGSSEAGSEVGCSEADDSEAGDSEAGDEVGDSEAGDSEAGDEREARGQGCSSSGKLWGMDQFPEGTKGHALWDWQNILAAQAWSCPCTDRRSCIGQERLKPEALLIHRKEQRTSMTGNARDASRSQLAQHFSSATKSFSRSFVVGELNDCCAASRGLADGLSWATWSRARSDCRKQKPFHAGRCKFKLEQTSNARRAIAAYIRDLRSEMDGSKGGSRGAGKSYTGKKGRYQRYVDYRNYRIRHKLPVLGGQRLFNKVWDEQENLVEISATGHSKCDECAKIEALTDSAEGMANREALLHDISLRADLHRKEHRGERDYGDDMWTAAEKHPRKVTMLNMDAPTSDQLEIPVQARQYRDVAKCLEETPRWLSKMMGVMVAGVGMLCFVAHQRMGGGANLSCTSIYLTLLYMVANGRVLGSQFRLLLDNTTSENKCNEVIFFICWLVANGIFDDASFFCMMKGHTYTGLDQSFNRPRELV